MLLFRAAFILGLCIALSCGASPRGSIFLVGGAEDDNNTEIYGGMINAAGGRNAVVAVITAPGEDPCCDPDSSWALYEQIFKAYAPKSVWWVPIDEAHIDNNKNASVVANLSKSTLFFFSGGDQARVIDSFYIAPNHTDSLALKAIRARFLSSSDAVIAGTSAGTACQTSRVMFMDGESYSALVNGSFAYNSTGVDNLLYDPLGGLGFFPFVVDTHFSERGRQGRLMRLLADTQHQIKGATVGFGVDQNTALASGPEADTYQVVGAAGVWWFDVANATISATAGLWTIRNVRASYATRGDVLSSDGRVRVASWKTPLKGHETHNSPRSSSDIFNSPYAPSAPTPREFTDVATSLLDSRTGRVAVGRTYERHPRYCVIMDRSDAIGWAGSAHSPRYISVQDLLISIVPDNGRCDQL